MSPPVDRVARGTTSDSCERLHWRNDCHDISLLTESNPELTAPMLVDSHCHLDFPDFAAELDAIVARAEAAGVGRMVTISTRVRQHAQVLAIAERFPNVTCSVGTHPHHAHEELDITADELIARASIRRSWRSARRGSTITTTTRRATRRRRASAPTSRRRARRGLPLVIHTREADEDTARILEEEMGKGPFSAVLHCYTGGAELARRAVALGCYYRLHRHRDVQELGRPARDRQGRAGGPLPDRDRRAVPRAACRIAASATSRPTSPRSPRCWPRCAASRSRRSRARPRRISSNCSQRCRAPAAAAA